MNYQQTDWLPTESPSTRSAEDFPAKTSASQGKAQDSRALEAASGGSSTGSSRKRGRSGSSRKTSQPFAIEDWTKFSGASLRSGMMRNGTVYPLPPLALLTAGTESGSWPTPTTMDGLAPKTQKAIVREMTEVRPGRTAPSNLRDQVTWGRTFGQVRQKLWPTPTAVWRPMEGNVRILRAKVLSGEMTESEATAMLGKSPMEAQGTIPALWPTPTANSSNQCSVDAALKEAERLHPAGRWTLMSQVAAEMVHGNRMWPTPAARDWRGANGYDATLNKLQNGIRAHLDQLPNAVQMTEGKAIRGTLNPTWVEWLMGFPIGWTDLKHWVTRSSRKSQKSSEG